MQVRLHANAATTPKTRAYIQQSSAPVAELAIELGVSETTIRRWKNRTTAADGSHKPKRLAISLSPLEEDLVLELRRKLALPLDDLAEVDNALVVMAGLDPTIQAKPLKLLSVILNGRVKPGHDSGSNGKFITRSCAGMTP